MSYTESAFNPYEVLLNQIEKYWEQYLLYSFKQFYFYQWLEYKFQNTLTARLFRNFKREEPQYLNSVINNTLWHKHIRMNLEPTLLARHNHPVYKKKEEDEIEPTWLTIKRKGYDWWLKQSNKRC
jgi:hypothetical protein